MNVLLVDLNQYLIDLPKTRLVFEIWGYERRKNIHIYVIFQSPMMIIFLSFLPETYRSDSITQ